MRFDRDSKECQRLFTLADLVQAPELQKNKKIMEFIENVHIFRRREDYITKQMGDLISLLYFYEGDCGEGSFSDENDGKDQYKKILDAFEKENLTVEGLESYYKAWNSITESECGKSNFQLF